MDAPALHEHLARLRARRPELAPLIDRLGPEAMPTGAFLRAYLGSDLNYGSRSQVLRTVLADPSLLGEHGAGEPDIHTYRRTAAFLLEHPLAPTDWRATAFTRDHLPKHLTRLFGLERALGTSRPGPWAFIDHFALAPYERARGMPVARLPDGRSLPAGTSLDFLAPVYEAACPALAELRDLVGRGGSGLRYERLVGLQARGLAARNAIALVGALLDQDAHGAALQNRIPRPLSAALGLRALSVPQLQLFADVFGLAYEGLLETSQVSAAADFLGLGEKLGAWAEAGAAADRPAVADALVGRPLLDAERAAAMHPARAAEAGRGQYDSALVCNVTRLVERAGQGGYDFRAFAPYYDAVRTGALAWRVLGHYERVDAGFARWLEGRMRAYPELFTGIRVRDLANSLYLAHAAEARGEPVYPALPSAARRTLGEREYAGRARPSGSGPRRRRTPAQPVQERPLAVWDRLRRDGPAP